MLYDSTAGASAGGPTLSSQFKTVILAGPGKSLLPFTAVSPRPSRHHRASSSPTNVPISSSPLQNTSYLSPTGESLSTSPGSGGGFAGAPGASSSAAGGGPTSAGTNLGPIATTFPKALLPIANHPILDNLLDFVDKANLKDVLLLAPKSQQHQLSSYLRAHKSNLDSIDAISRVESPAQKIELHCYDDGIYESSQQRQDQQQQQQQQESNNNAAADNSSNTSKVSKPQGTAGVIAWAMSKGFLKTDFILLPCDFLYLPASQTSPTLQSLLDHHRAHGNLVTSLFYTRDAANEDVSKPPPEDGHPVLVSSLSTGSDPVLLDTKEFDNIDDDSVDYRSKIFLSYPRVSITTSLLAAHVYVCSKPVLEIISRFPHVESASFSDHVIPLLAKAQWQKHLLDKKLNESPIVPWIKNKSSSKAEYTPLSRSLGKKLSHTYSDPVRQQEQQSSLTTFAPRPVPPMTSFGQGSSQPFARKSSDSVSADSPSQLDELDSSQDQEPTNQLNGRIGVVVWCKNDGFMTRVNNFVDWKSANTASTQKQKQQQGQAQQQQQQQKTKKPGQVSSDSTVSEQGVVIGEKSSIRKTSVAKNCTIGTMSKLNTCIVMEGALIGENVKLDNCIIGPAAVIEDKANLKDCEVAGGYHVTRETTLKGERLTIQDD